jgi:citronellol/citronellal dehydrogenase
MSHFQGRTYFITGASRGIGLAIALRLAREGANIAIAAKSATPHATLPGTIYTAAEEIEQEGGKALPCVVDVRDERSIKAALEKTASTFGGIDGVINNASAIQLKPLSEISIKRMDLMWQVNARGTLITSKLALPYLAKSERAHILMLSPPLDMRAKWFAGHTPYTMAKYGMSMAVLGLAGELAPQNIAVNALWPRTAIATSAVKNLLGGDAALQACRKADIVADAAAIILAKEPADFTGQFCIDDTLLAEHGVTDFEPYRVNPAVDLQPDFFIPEEDTPPASLKSNKSKRTD